MRIVVEKDVPAVCLSATMFGHPVGGPNVIDYLEENLARALMDDNLVGIESTLKMRQDYSVRFAATGTTISIQAVSASHWL
jgi:hypothetical protein